MSATRKSSKGHSSGVDFPLPPGELPASLAAEQAVLAATMIDAGQWPHLAARLRCQDFAVRQHRVIFRAIRHLANHGQAIDILTVQARLEEQGELEQAGGLGYLHCLDCSLPDLAGTPSYVEIVKGRALLRGLAALGTELVRQADEGHGAAERLLSLAEGKLLELSVDNQAPRLAPVRDVVKTTLADLEDAPLDGLPELASGLPELDAMTHGLGRGNLILIAGRPGTGKTSLALAIARDLTLRQGKRTALFSLEMSAPEITLRVLSAESGVPLKNLRRGHLSRHQWERTHAEAARLAQCPLALDDGSRLSLFDLSSAARRHKLLHGLDAVIVDYLQLMRPDRAYPTEVEALGSISRGLKLLARELNVPVVGLCQLSRASERRGIGSRPQLSDLRGSGRFEEDADLVIFPYCPLSEADKPEAEVLLLIAKQRNGETGEVPVTFHRELVSFRSRFTHHQPHGG